MVWFVINAEIKHPRVFILILNNMCLRDLNLEIKNENINKIKSFIFEKHQFLFNALLNSIAVKQAKNIKSISKGVAIE